MLNNIHVGVLYIIIVTVEVTYLVPLCGSPLHWYTVASHSELSTFS